METLNVLESIKGKGKDPILFNYVLQIDAAEYLEGDHYFVDKTCFCHVTLPQALYLIRHSHFSIGALVVTPNKHFRAIEELRNEARIRSIPFILFSLKFDQRVRDMAIELKTDDYQWGVLTLPQNYIDFMKRLKRFQFDFRGTTGKRKSIKTSFWKRCLDILISSLLLFLLSPTMIIIALIIKAGSRGPVLNVFQQAGYGYKIFNTYEFRTDTQRGNGNHWAVQFGEFLRESGLSKLPEIINVLKGDISLVGGKPLSLNEAAKLTTDKNAIRLLSTPGLTGLWGVGKYKFN